MVEMIVRCPYCVLEDEFRPMLPMTQGKYGCASCGHLAAPGDGAFHCLCVRCAPMSVLVRRLQDFDAEHTHSRK